MRDKYSMRIELGRVTQGDWATKAGERHGMFLVQLPRSDLVHRVIAGRGLGWEHVSVSLPHRCPTWDEMAAIKRYFWDDTEAVVQYHPAETDYVNVHPYCLHLWRPIDAVLPTPPVECV